MEWIYNRQTSSPTWVALSNQRVAQTGTKEGIHSKLGKARSVFREVNDVWRSTQYSINTKLKLCWSCVVSTLLYKFECWRIAEADLTKLQSFHTICLCQILRIFWLEKISNKNLLQRCQQEDMGDVITRRRWKWIGHVLRRDPQSITKTALHWTPDGKKKRGRSRAIWRKTVESEMKTIKNSWGSLT